MAWNFSKTIRLGGVNINLTKTWWGWSAGGPLMRVGKDAKGRDYVTQSIPGTGLYRRECSTLTTDSETMETTPRTAVATRSGWDTANDIFDAGVKVLLFVGAQALIIEQSQAVGQKKPWP
jgi:hypothetical protein